MATSKRKKEQRQRELKRQAEARKTDKYIAQQSLFGNRSSTSKDKPYVPNTSKYRQTTHYPSNTSTASAAATAKRESPQYTGDFLVGLSTLHKSNSVPVTRDDDPTIFAQMRRN